MKLYLFNFYHTDRIWLWNCVALSLESWIYYKLLHSYFRTSSHFSFVDHWHAYLERSALFHCTQNDAPLEIEKFSRYRKTFIQIFALSSSQRYQFLGMEWYFNAPTRRIFVWVCKYSALLFLASSICNFNLQDSFIIDGYVGAWRVWFARTRSLLSLSSSYKIWLQLWKWKFSIGLAIWKLLWWFWLRLKGLVR